MTRCRVFSGWVLCLSVICVYQMWGGPQQGGGKSCKRKCNVLKKNTDAHSGASHFCYRYSEDYGEVMHSVSPVGGQSKETTEIIDKTRYENCGPICSGSPLIGKEVMTVGAEKESIQVLQRECVATP